jgi:phosphatidylglycerophosphate synthase
VAVPGVPQGERTEHRAVADPVEGGVEERPPRAACPRDPRDGAVFGALALWYAGDGHSQTLCAVALYDLVAGVVTSYAKARAESLGMTANVGIAERSERLIVILAFTGLSGLFSVPVLRSIALWGLAAATTVTVAQRIVEVRRQSRLLVTPPAP